MAIDLKYLHPRGTRASLNSLASANQLNPGQIYYLTDEGRLAVASSTSTFLTTAKEGEGSGAPLNSPAFTGTPTAPTATGGTNTTQIATTAFVTSALGPYLMASTASASYAPLASPALTGTPTAPTQTAGNNTTRIATTAFVTAADNLKANLASPPLTGTPTAPTAAVGTNTTQLATTAYAMSAAIPRTMGGFVAGRTLPGEIVTGAIWPTAATVNSANCNAQAITAATASTVFTIKNKTTGLTVGTFTFGAGSSNATVSLSNSSVSAFNFLYIEAPATADATLANITFLVRA